MTDAGMAVEGKCDEPTQVEIRADRACIGCGFNLYGQSVTKEDHYGLAICRCPECGTVAALQSYPVMGHWVNRFRALIAALWIVVLVGFFIGNSMSWMGMSIGASNLAGQKMSEHIGEAHYIWKQEKDAVAAEALAAQQATNGVPAAGTTAAPAPVVPGLPAGTTIVTTNGVTSINGVVVAGTPANSSVPTQFRWTWLDGEWMEHHLGETIASRGGLYKNIDTEFLIMLIPGTIVAFLFGMFWSIALLGGSKKKAAIVPVVAGGVALLVLLGISIPDKGTTFASSLTQDLYGPVIGPMYIGMLVAVSMVGIFLGRMIARWVVVMALPPRNRVPLSLLWICDGKAMPKP